MVQRKEESWAPRQACPFKTFMEGAGRDYLALEEFLFSPVLDFIEASCSLGALQGAAVTGLPWHLVPYASYQGQDRTCREVPPPQHAAGQHTWSDWTQWICSKPNKPLLSPENWYSCTFNRCVFMLHSLMFLLGQVMQRAQEVITPPVKLLSTNCFSFIYKLPSHFYCTSPKLYQSLMTLVWNKPIVNGGNDVQIRKEHSAYPERSNK